MNDTSKKHKITLNQRNLSILVFALFFSWLLAVPFQGQVLYALAEYHKTSVQSYINIILLAHFTGLLLCGVFVRSVRSAKLLMLGSILICLASSTLFFLKPSFLWAIALVLSSFLAGACVAAWSFFLQKGMHQGDRIKVIADCLIFSNLLMIAFGITAVYFSAFFGLTLSMISLAAAFIFTLKLPSQEDHTISVQRREKQPVTKLFKPLFMLCLFIAVITINSGLMYAVQVPAFAHLQGLTIWYWAVPYIASIFLMRHMTNPVNKSYFLYAAMAMIGLSFIAFVTLDRSVLSYLVVDTLMLGACGIFDLFWWSILIDMTFLDNNPAKILGIGLSANVFGVFIGGVVGSSVLSGSELHIHSAFLALGIVCVALVLLPILQKKLDHLLHVQNYEPETIGSAEHQKKNPPDHADIASLTERENEITALLVKGYTYKAISVELHVSENTVRTHIKNIYAKCGVQSRAALMNKMLKPPSPKSE